MTGVERRWKMMEIQCLDRAKPAHPDLNYRDKMRLMLALVSWVPCWLWKWARYSSSGDRQVQQQYWIIRYSESRQSSAQLGMLGKAWARGGAVRLEQGCAWHLLQKWMLCIKESSTLLWKWLLWLGRKGSRQGMVKLRGPIWTVGNGHQVQRFVSSEEGRRRDSRKETEGNEQHFTFQDPLDSELQREEHPSTPLCTEIAQPDQQKSECPRWTISKCFSG